MYIVRWLTNHPILAVWALTIVALLLSLGGSKEKHSEPDVAANAHSTSMVEQHAVSASDDKQQEMVVPTDHAVATVVVAEEVNGTNTEVVVVEQVAIETKDVSTLEPTAMSEGVPSEVNDDATNSDLGDKSSEDLLLMAREAYWNNGLDEASSIYEQLIAREPNVIEYKGELGNVYWRQGFPEKSANLYAEIAIPMIESGDGDRVSNMVGFIGLFHPDKAAEISKYLQGAGK